MEFDERRYRPLSTVDLFDEAFDLYKRNFVLLLSVVAIIVVPTAMLTDIYALKWINAVSAQLIALQSNAADPSVALNDLTEFFKDAVLSLSFYIPVWTVEFVAVTVAVSARYLDRPMTIGLTYLESVRRFLPALAATALFIFLSLLGVAIMAVSIVFPDLAPALISVGGLVELFTALVVTARYPLFMGAIVVEKMGPVKALNRSAELTKGDTGRLVSALLCLFVITAVIYSALQGVIVLLAGGIVSSEYLTVPALQQNRFVASQIAGDVSNLLMTPFEIIVLTLLYFDQRIRKEGYDMELLANRLGYHPVSVPLAAYAPAVAVRKRSGKR